MGNFLQASGVSTAPVTGPPAPGLAPGVGCCGGTAGWGKGGILSEGFVRAASSTAMLRRNSAFEGSSSLLKNLEIWVSLSRWHG